LAHHGMLLRRDGGCCMGMAISCLLIVPDIGGAIVPLCVVKSPQVSSTKIGATGPRERRLEDGGDFGLANSLFGNSAVRLARRRPSHRSNGSASSEHTRDTNLNG